MRWRKNRTYCKTLVSPVLLATALLCCSAAGAIQIEAVSGSPFGVGRIRLPAAPGELPPVLGAEGISISNRDGRILYPVVQAPLDTTLVNDLVLDSPWMRGGPVRQQAGGILRGLLNRPAPTTVYFLFRGSEPLEVTIEGRAKRKYTVQPIASPHYHAPLLQAWWRNYSASPEGWFRPARDYPPVVSNYLQAMLARRIGLPLGSDQDDNSWQEQLEGQLGFFLGTEKVRLAIARDRMLGRGPASGVGTLPVPKASNWPPLALPESSEKVQIEPIADRVPAECLYVRFGTFNNFLWLQDTLKTWGGDLANLVSLRGLDTGQSQRMENQLAVKQTALSRLLGPTIISDVAIVGTDMFMREGAAYGLLFEARNTFLLENDLKRQRSERLKRGGVTEKKVKIAGRDVSFLSSPDGSVRSFYVSDGKYVFVTTSKTLARRFLETADGGSSLGKSAEFRHARSVMPLSRDDTVFIYLSDAFFQNMSGPAYWIEIYRRLQAAADVQLLEMATLASATEGKSADSIDALVADGFLPSDFGPRGDGSRALLVDGNAIDSLRGRRGYFTPIPDVPVEQATAAETEAYRKFVDFCRAKWGRLDPILIGIKRHAPVDRIERVVLDIRANPFDQRHYALLSQWLGAPDADRLAPIPGDMIAMEAQLTNQRLFGAIRDAGSASGTWRDLFYGYIGTTGRLGFLSLLDRSVTTPPNADGLAGQQGGVWRRRDERFTVFSLSPAILGYVWPQLRFEPAKRPAQVRIRVEDASQAGLTSSLATLSYYRTRDTSLGNLRLLHDMSEQLRVPPQDAKKVAEMLLDARLVCPLGGEYEFVSQPNGSGYWTSTAIQPGPDGRLDTRVPDGYAAPPLSWFRGMQAELTMMPRELAAHVEVLMLLPDEPLLAEPNETPQASPPPKKAEPVKTPKPEPGTPKPAPGREWLKKILQTPGE